MHVYVLQYMHMHIYVCKCVYVYIRIYVYMCVFIYMHIHIPTKSTICCPHVHDREAIYWNMEHVQTTRGHTFRENGFFYPQKLSALSSSSVRGGRLMSSLPQSKLLTELNLHSSYRQPQPLWVYEYRDRPCSEDTVLLQSSGPVVIQHFCPLLQDNLWAFGEGMRYRCPIWPSTKRRHLIWNFGIGSFSWLKCVPQVHVLTT